ncbi:uncharacterized protein LOC132270207 [Cornus florida]|uniref:uncharacterized protein LOC132270207 n=1 Tax=Cornus florida TaxID=4283 RepID=UPI00289AA2E2|nr:uncharacterized protein LOC132270207 [Cornus florida]
MKQHEDERLQAFLTQFNLVKSMVMECHSSIAVQAFKLAMNRGTPFHTSLVVNTPKTMDELNKRADSFVHLEEEEAANEPKETSGDADRNGGICRICSRSGVPYENPLVVSLTIAEYLVRRVLIDPGSSANVMPRLTFDRLKIEPEKLKPTGNPLLRFDGKRVEPIGMVELIVQVTERVLSESFVVIEIHPSYNLLMGRGWIHRVQGVPSTLHQAMRYLGPDGTKVIDIHEDQIDYKKPNRTTRVGSRLTEEEKLGLIDFLTRNAYVFAWSHSDMPGISPSVSCHSLNVDPNVKPMKQKQRRFALERNRIIVEEIDRLLEAGFIREVQYLAWLSNVVVVQKKNGKWRVCINFTNLNKACPNDSFSLPQID